MRIGIFENIMTPGGHEVDFDEVLHRSGMYAEFERHAYERECNLLKEGGENG